MPSSVDSRGMCVLDAREGWRGTSSSSPKTIEAFSDAAECDLSRVGKTLLLCSMRDRVDGDAGIPGGRRKREKSVKVGEPRRPASNPSLAEYDDDPAPRDLRLFLQTLRKRMHATHNNKTATLARAATA